jgi:hypothetical protein
MVGDDLAHPNTDIVIHDFILVGNDPTPGTFTEGTESEANLQIYATTRVEIYDITASAAPGDFVHFEQTHNAWIHDCHVPTTGRNGISVISGSDILVEDCAFDVSGYCTFDIEPNAVGDACSNITIRNNTAETWGDGLFLGVEGQYTGAAIDGIIVDGNTITNDSLRTNCTNIGTAGTRMTRISFTNNKGMEAAGPLLYFGHIDGLTVTGNAQPLSSGVLTSITDCTGVQSNGLTPEVQASLDTKLTITLTNLVTNGEFETNVTGWASDGATISRTTVDPLVGTGSLKAIYLNGTINAYATGITLIVGHSYHLEGLVGSTAAAGKTMRAEVGDIDGVQFDCSVAATLVSLDFVYANGSITFHLIDGVATEYFLLDSVVLNDFSTSTTTAELDLIHGLTATAAELNKLDGIDTTATELGYVHDVTSAIQTQLNAKAPLAPAGATYTPATGGQTVALDVTTVNMHVVTGHADGTAITFTIANAANNQPFVVSILQGAVVSTIAAWFATIRWAGGTAPTLTATVGKRDTFGFIRTGANTYDGFVIGQNA